MLCLQVDMRDFLNAPNGLSKQPLTANERAENDPSRSPLVGRMTVWKLFIYSVRSSNGKPVNHFM